MRHLFNGLCKREVTCDAFWKEINCLSCKPIRHFVQPWEPSENIVDSSSPDQWHSWIKNTHQPFEKGGIKRVTDMSEDFAEGKYRPPMAVYCGTIRNNKAAFKPIRSNSVDSDLHLRTGGWMSKGKAILQSSLNLPLKKTCFIKSTKGSQQSTGGWVLDSNHFYHLFDGSRSQAASHIHGYSVKLDWAETETESGHPSLDTLQLKNKLKRRMSEILPQKSPFEAVLPLKPTLARSASQRLLKATRPIPPIERRASSQTNGAHDQDLLPNDKNKEASADELPGCPRSEAGEGYAEPATVPEEIQISLQQLRSSAEKKRKLLCASLSQSSFKLPSSVGSSIQPLPSRPVQQTLHITMTPLERDPFTQGPSSSPEEQEPQPPAAIKDDCATELKETKNSRNRVKSAPITERKASREDTSSPQTKTHQSTGRCPVQSAPSVAEKDKGEGSLQSQTMVISFRLSTELGPDVSRQEPVEDEETENEERVCHMMISKSAQEKMRQKRREEMEQRQQRKERELTQQLRDRLQDINPRSGSLPVPELLNSREFSKISRSTSGLNDGSSLRKRVNRPSLPSIPNITQTYNVPRHFSAHSLPGFPLDSPEGEEETDVEEFLEMNSFSHQEQGLTEALKLLADNDWEMKRKGLSSVRRLARSHQELLLTRLHTVCLAVTKEVNNLRSKVARSAILSVSELFSQLKRNMDQEVDEVTRILLHKTGDSNEFIREEAVKALAVVVENVSSMRALTALIAGGLNHRNAIVRRCTAENLLCIVEHLGAERLLSGTKDNTDQIVQTMVKFSQDGNQETRSYGRKALNILVSYPEFERYMERSLLSQDLHHIITAIKQRGLGDASSDPYLPKGRSSRVNSSSNCQENKPNTARGELVTPQQQRLMTHRPIIRSMESVEQVKQLNKLLSAKEFQERTHGISLLLRHCETNPGFVTSNVVNIFDAFIPRLQDSNKKVNQFALRSMATMIPVLKDDLHRVLHSTVTVVTENLNSKNTGIYTAAVHVLDTLIDHIDNLLLLQPLASRVQFISGRAMQDITERLAVLVLPVYRRKPQAVERYVLPVLWYLLSNMTGSGVIKGGSGNVRAVTAKLATSLHQQMGAGLQEYASSQPAHVIKTLRELTEKEL
ncbi:TOG array regulator of axonemal microtubules protein 2-like isoform X2 [Heterodontus francisci]|uniref:TOG array regulator of axonemal microtubules protein 2-like isoform X2 n=1 Tax=Heterodontus francisci TaxID=7792 RepID=UPI00355BB6F9